MKNHHRLSLSTAFLMLAASVFSCERSDLKAANETVADFRRNRRRQKKGGGKGGAGILLQSFCNPTGKPIYGQKGHIHPRHLRAA